ncbi:MAG: hypothetical protein ACOCUA_01925 [archaeon]
MATNTVTLRACPVCESNDWERTATERVPGGIDWRYFACDDCGHEWRV